MDRPAFPTWYVNVVRSTELESFWPTVVECLKDEYSARELTCPNCENLTGELEWFAVDTSIETWRDGTGQSGHLVVCLDCDHQVEFFVDEILTEIESEVRESGCTSSGMWWSSDGTLTYEDGRRTRLSDE